MIRDFTSEAEEKLLGLVQEVEDEQWFGWTDALGDLCLDIGAWAGCLDVKDYADDMQKYHKKVIDKNDASKADIKNIFDAVYTIDDGYNARFCSLKMMNDSFIDSVNSLKSVLSIGKFKKTEISCAAARIKRNNTAIGIYSRVAGNGLLEQNIEDLDPNEVEEIISALGEFVSKTNHIENEREVRIPLGPYIEYYYKHKVEVGASNAVIGKNSPINLKLDDQNKLKLDNITGKIPIFNKAGFLKFSSKGELGIEAKKAGMGPFDEMGATLSLDKDGLKGDARVTYGDLTLKALTDKNGVGFSIARKDNNDLYTFKAQENLLQRTIEFSAAIQVTDDVKVTDTHGLVIRNHSEPDQRLPNWQRMAIPDEIASPYTNQMPQITLEDFDWELSVEILAVTAGVIVVVVAAPYVVAAAPEIIATAGVTEAAVGGTAVAGGTVIASESPQIQMIVTEGEQFVAEHSSEIIQCIEDLFAA